MKGIHKINNHTVEDVFNKQILLSEKFRVQILLTLLASLFIVVFVMFTIFKEEYLSLFNDPDSLTWISVCIGFFILYEIFVLQVIKYFIKSNKTFPAIGRFGNSFFEVSFPTIMMVVISASVNPLLVITGPLNFAYFLFIILSTLRLDFRLSVFTGTVAAAEFMGIHIYHTIYSSDQIISFFTLVIFSFGKSFILFICGVAAGLVSNQIRKRVINTLHVIEERNKIINIFGQQVSPEIAEELLSKEDEQSGVIKNVCIMFFDIRNFTPMAARKNPKEIVAYQNEIFSMATEIINKHKGIINQFLGDGFMATFGAPIYRGNDCQNAVNAAEEIVCEIEKKNIAGSILPTKVGIGIHYGEAITGNIGSSLRRQYSITGNVVILASRIEQLNKEFNSQILVSKEVLDNINSTTDYTSLGLANIKGREEKIEIFKLA